MFIYLFIYFSLTQNFKQFLVFLSSMALPHLITSHSSSSSSSSLTHQPSINPNAVNPSLLNPNLKPFYKSSSLSQSRRFHMLSSLRCSASSFPEKNHTNPPTSNDVVELPLFPLPLVLFPGAVLPLQIFEFRYRIMMHTLLHTASSSYVKAKNGSVSPTSSVRSRI